MQHLLIAGHGRNRDGSYDPGASGWIKEGEHAYMKDTLFPAMQKLLAPNSPVHFFTDYSVYSHGNFVDLSRSYGKDVAVTEFHFDAALSDQARGGHVIIYQGFQPDALDLRLRDAIKGMVGVRYQHLGHQGISGRRDLAHVNLAARHGINYRLIELGFGTNQVDASILKDRVNDYAQALVSALNLKTRTKDLVFSKNLEKVSVYSHSPTCMIGKKVGEIYPARFNGLTYKVIDQVFPDIYVIQTRDYGQVVLSTRGLQGVEVKER